MIGFMIDQPFAGRRLPCYVGESWQNQFTSFKVNEIIDIRALFWTAILLRALQAHVYPCTAVTPVNNFRLNFFFENIKTMFNKFVDHARIFVDITYLCIFPGQQEHAKLCIQWFNLAGVRGNKKKQHIKGIHVDLDGTLGKLPGPDVIMWDCILERRELTAYAAISNGIGRKSVTPAMFLSLFFFVYCLKWYFILTN